MILEFYLSEVLQRIVLYINILQGSNPSLSAKTIISAPQGAFFISGRDASSLAGAGGDKK